ncbi:MAG: response regulator, partial [Acidobacteriota bacterium]
MNISKTILIAHPDRETGQRLAAALFNAGFEALAVRRPEEVLRNAVGSNPRLVLIDVRMPQVGGYELQSRLTATGLEVPLIVVFGVKDGDVPDGTAPEGVFVIPAERSDEDSLVDAVRLLSFAEQV